MVMFHLSDIKKLEWVVMFSVKNGQALTWQVINVAILWNDAFVFYEVWDEVHTSVFNLCYYHYYNLIYYIVILKY